MTQRFARSYADAVFNASEDQREAENVLKGVRSLVEAMETEPALAKMAASPSVPQEVKSRILDALGGRLNFTRLTRRFLGLLLKNYRLHHLPAVLEALEEEYDRRAGVIVAEITVASEPRAKRIADPYWTKDLVEALSKLHGRAVRAKIREDPALIAGFRARVGSTLYDASLSGQLDRLTTKLAEAGA